MGAYAILSKGPNSYTKADEAELHLKLVNDIAVNNKLINEIFQTMIKAVESDNSRYKEFYDILNFMRSNLQNTLLTVSIN